MFFLSLDKKLSFTLKCYSNILAGEVSERSKVHDWKSCVVKSYRGFESPPLRLGDRYQATCAAQPRQDRKIAAVSGFHVRPGPFVAFFF